MSRVNSAPPIGPCRCAYRRGLNNSAGLDNLLLVQLRAGSVKIADDGGHTGLVAHGSGEVDGLLGVILREAARIVSSACTQSRAVQRLPLHLTPVAGSALSRQERQRTVTGSLELPVRHLEIDVLWLVVVVEESKFVAVVNRLNHSA